MSNLNKSADQIRKLIAARVKKGERDTASRYAVLLNDIRRELATVYESYEVGGKLTYAEMAKYDRLNKFMSQVNHLIGPHFKDLKKIIYGVLGESYLDGYYLTAWAVETETLSRLGYSVVAAETITAMIENPISGLTLNDRLEKKRLDIIYTIQQEVTQGLVKGETYRTMARRLKGSLENDAVKTMRIVRTEGHRVQESSRHDSTIHAHKNGVRMLKKWNDSQDERVRENEKEDHSELGKRAPIPVDQLFTQGGASGPCPGQMGAAAHDINCRCFVTYSVEKIEKVDAKELQDMAFETWKKERLKAA
ncbi:hypothetical protein AWH48_12065 [Domibacillus aminovorans]|uniref:Phage head morphogenesis domain-containing protein n=1 Tax=Domibacillus aminovorans TaxID=29332 RepID=A0A177KIX9_9BACI|nr:phage minor head protein [Domibacillus aminovorans]OAH53087.1 hypothetical protein AWH48_12065 [Domibacillus aminovorans]